MSIFGFQHGNRPARSPEEYERLRIRSEKRSETVMKRRGRRVRSVEQLFKLSMQKRSVLHIGWRTLTPVAVLISMQARIVHDMISRGYIYEYKRPDERQTPNADS